DFQDSPDDEEDTRSSQEYMNDLEIEFHERGLLAKSKRFFKKGVHKSLMVQRQLIKLSATNVDEEEVSFDDNKMVDVKVLMTLADDESGVVGKESDINYEWVKIFIRKISYRANGSQSIIYLVNGSLHA
ncbi:hypothetical protein Tco_1453060, partial [Tanacetum coccineum]